MFGMDKKEVYLKLLLVGFVSFWAFLLTSVTSLMFNATFAFPLTLLFLSALGYVSAGIVAARIICPCCAKRAFIVWEKSHVNKNKFFISIILNSSYNKIVCEHCGHQINEVA